MEGRRKGIIPESWPILGGILLGLALGLAFWYGIYRLIMHLWGHRRRIMREIIRCHRANRKLYRAVMGGGL